MPNRDGTGPFGKGGLTGKGMGNCNDTFYRGVGRQRGYSNRGFRSRWRCVAPESTINNEELLIKEKEYLVERIQDINNQLENTKENPE